MIPACAHAGPAQNPAMMAGQIQTPMNLPSLLKSLRLPPSPPRRRPAELIYAADERLPPAALLTLGLQHVATALALTAYVLAASRIAGLSAPDTHSFLAVTLLAMAACTGLQAWGGRLGAGALLVHIPSPVMITFVAAVLTQYGTSGMAALTMTSGIAALLIAPLLIRLRPLFPPTVAGVVVCVAGVSLIGSSVHHALGLDEQLAIRPASLLVSGVALTCIVAFSVWGGRRLRLLGLLAGIGAGVVAAAFTGDLQGFQQLAGTPVFALPSVPVPTFAIDPTLVAALLLVAVLSQLDTLGCVIVVDKMDNADWRRADMKAVARGIRANGLGDVATSLLGPFPTGVSSANIALAHATGSTSRYIGLAVAALLALAAFMPQVTVALTLIPTPVLGAVELYAAAFLIVSGMELVASRALDSRAIFMVGLSISAGLAIMLLPGLATHAPASLQFLLGSGFVVAGFFAVLLNLLFRLGSSQRAQISLDGSAATARAVTEFVETRGAAWGARRDVVQRAALAALEAAEAIERSHGSRVTGLRGFFDEFNLDIELLHSGAPMSLAAAPAMDAHAAAALWEADDDSALDAAVARASGLLLRHLADRVSDGPGSAAGTAFLKLHFNH